MRRVSKSGLYLECLKMKNQVLSCHGIFGGVWFGRSAKKGKKDEKMRMCAAFRILRGRADHHE